MRHQIYSLARLTTSVPTHVRALILKERDKSVRDSRMLINQAFVRFSISVNVRIPKVSTHHKPSRRNDWVLCSVRLGKFIWIAHCLGSSASRESPRK